MTALAYTHRHTRARYSLSVMLLAGTVLTGFSTAAKATETVTNISVDPELLTTVQEALPERSAVDQSYLNPSYDPNLYLSEDSQIGITFLDEGAGYRNTLGYFTFQDDSFADLTFGDIDTNNSGNISMNELDSLSGVDVDVVFSNASEAGGGGSLRPGDTVVLGGGSVSQGENGSLDMTDGTVFSAGTNMGFLVAANAWNGQNVTGWDNNWGDPAVYYSIDFLNPENDRDATLGTTTETNRHVAMMFASADQSDILIGFEDLNRNGPSDEDFNDVVFTAFSDPRQALSQSKIETFSAAPGPVAGTGIGGLVFFGGLMGLLVRRRRESNPEGTPC